MSDLGKLFFSDKAEVKQKHVFSRGVNAVEKRNFLAVFTGGGFRLYDKTDYSLLMKETGLSYVYDGEFSNDLRMFAMKSWDGYAIFYDLSTKEKIKKISLLDKRNKFDIAADCGCTFGPTKDTFYDIVYSDTLFISVVNQYNTAKMERERTFFRDAHFYLNDIGYSETEKAFWILGYERINYTEKNGRGAFTDNSEAFILWSENLSEFERYSLEQKSPFITSLYYLEEERNFIAYDLVEGYTVYDRTGKWICRKEIQ